jgi:Na+-transporting NADH:ubiquinone oxidoreductase subunit A
VKFRISKGMDIPIAGSPEQVIEAGPAVGSVALLGSDYAGLKPQVLVQAGDRVRAGQTLFTDKRDPAVSYAAPGSGIVRAVNRGTRRALQSIIIDLDAEDQDAPAYPALRGRAPATLMPDEIRAHLWATGLWTGFRTRPFDKVPLSGSEPRSIFVTAMDTRPLAGDPALITAEHGAAFELGLEMIATLTAGPVYLCTAADWTGPTGPSERIRHVRFEGPHPAGLPGTHIHHLDPVGADRIVWYVGYQDVIAIGRLFGEARLHLERVVALGGGAFRRPRLLRTRLGASIDELLPGELDAAAAAPRVISGSVLHGRAAAAGPAAFIGRYDQQVCAIPGRGDRRLFGWLRAISRAPTFAGVVRRRPKHKRALSFTAALNGRPTALVAVDAFEHIVPMDILPIPLLRALLIGDTDQAQALGCLELGVEDLALCSFVCPGKNDYGAVLQANLERIEREG